MTIEIAKLPPVDWDYPPVCAECGEPSTHGVIVGSATFYLCEIHAYGLLEELLTHLGERTDDRET